MKSQLITNNKGEKTAVIIPISEYEDLLHKRHLTPEVTEGCKGMIDKMLAWEGITQLNIFLSKPSKPNS